MLYGNWRMSSQPQGNSGWHFHCEPPPHPLGGWRTGCRSLPTSVTQDWSSALGKEQSTVRMSEQDLGHSRRPKSWNRMLENYFFPDAEDWTRTWGLICKCSAIHQTALQALSALLRHNYVSVPCRWDKHEEAVPISVYRVIPEYSTLNFGRVIRINILVFFSRSHQLPGQAWKTTCYTASCHESLPTYLSLAYPSTSEVLALGRADDRISVGFTVVKLHGQDGQGTPSFNCHRLHLNSWNPEEGVTNQTDMLRCLFPVQ